MRIAQIICRTDVFGGANRHCLDLSVALARRGHEIRLFTGSAGPVSTRYTAAGLPFCALPSFRRNPHPWHDSHAFVCLTNQLKEFKPDLVAAHASKAGALARLVAAHLGIPCTYTPHCWSFAPGFPNARLFLAAERLLGRLPAHIICVSDWEHRLALTYGVACSERLHAIPNGVDLPDAAPADPSRHPPHLLCLSRFEPQKDHRSLLLALARLKDLAWTATFAGDGPSLHAIRKQATALGLDSRVDFPGFATHPAQLLAKAQLLALPSLWESLPLTVLEAMQCGLPVLASDVGGVGEAVIQGQTGFLLPKQNVTAWTSSLRNLLSSPEERLRLGNNGRMLFLYRYSLLKMVEKTEMLYSAVVSKKNFTL